MKYIIRLAFLNMWRQKRRTILSFLIISFSMTIYIFFDSFFEGYAKSSIESVLAFDTGHLKIRSQNFEKNRPYAITNLFESIAQVESVLNGFNGPEAQNRIVSHTKRITIFGELDNTVELESVVITGIDFNTDAAVFNLTNFISEGSYNPDGVLIGSGLAKDMKLKAGDVVNLTFRNKEGGMVSISPYIAGIIDTVDTQVNNAGVYIQLQTLQSYIGTEGVMEITMRISDMQKAIQMKKEMQAALDKAVPGLKVWDWDEMSRDVYVLATAKQKPTYAMIFFLMLIGMIGIINTTIMSVYEKQREIGTLKALGMQDREMMWMFVFEGGVIGTLGAVFALIFGFIVNFYFATVGMDIAAIMGKSGDLGAAFKTMGPIHAGWSLKPYLLVIILSIGTGMIASWYPARKVMKMNAVDCLRVK